MDRILLLFAAYDYAMVDPALQSARTMARHPERLNWGICLVKEPDLEEQQTMTNLGPSLFLCPCEDVWGGAMRMYRGEEFILLGHPGMRFTRGWDTALLRVLSRLQTEAEPRAALTGYLPRCGDLLDAVCTVAVDSIDEQGMLRFHRGTPLRYVQEPQRSAMIHPDFCFAPAALFRELEHSSGPVFLRAHRLDWKVYTLHRPLIRLAWETPVLPCHVMELEHGGDRKLRQFEQLWGIHLASGQLSARLRRGVFAQDRKLPVRIPLSVRLREHLRAAWRGRLRVKPQCVTASVTLSASPHLPEEYLDWFGHLQALRRMKLLCYANGEHLRRLTKTHTVVREYRRRYGLPVQAAGEERTLNLLKLSKPFLLRTTREKQLTDSHYVWIDFGCLRYPMYRHTMLDWDVLCSDRIVLAAVNGVPDLSMFVVPERLVMPLCDEIARRCEVALQSTGALPEETTVWVRLIDERPEWFHVYALSGVRQLITLLTREGRNYAEGASSDAN